MMLKQIIYSALGVVALTVAGILYVPEVNFVHYVPEFMLGGLVLMVVVTFVSVAKEKELSEQGKMILMTGFLLAILVPSIYATSAYSHRIATSWSGGEVHWHADYEVVVQDENGEYHQLDLIDPARFCQQSEEGGYMCRLNDRTGVTEYHEHNDRRIHLEGTAKTREEATLRVFFQTFGGDLTNTRLVYPTNDRVWRLQNRENRTLKIAVQQQITREEGVGARWCLISRTAPEQDVCRSFDNNELARLPSEYVISPYQQGPIDIIYLVYDDASPQEVLADLREDDEYKGFGLVKSSEGY